MMMRPGSVMTVRPPSWTSRRWPRKSSRRRGPCAGGAPCDRRQRGGRRRNGRKRSGDRRGALEGRCDRRRRVLGAAGRHAAFGAPGTAPGAAAFGGVGGVVPARGWGAGSSGWRAARCRRRRSRGRRLSLRRRCGLIRRRRRSLLRSARGWRDRRGVRAYLPVVSCPVAVRAGRAARARGVPRAAGRLREASRFEARPSAAP